MTGEAAPARKCRRHEWVEFARPIGSDIPGPQAYAPACLRCGRPKDPAVSRRSKNNRKRGTSDELAVARILGGRKVGELGLPWDVEVSGYLRAQCKKLASWPSVNEVARWLDAIPAGPELRAVTLADTPGTGGGKTRRLIVMSLDEFAAWHAAKPSEGGIE